MNELQSSMANTNITVLHHQLNEVQTDDSVTVSVSCGECSDTQHRVLTWAKAVLKSAMAFMLITVVFGCSEGITYDPYNCYNPRHTQITDEEISTCMNHKFPTREEVFEYLNNSTFMRMKSKNDYSIIYYNPNGQWIKIHFTNDTVPWGTVFTDRGSWGVIKSILPMHSKNEIRKVTVADFCQRNTFWSISDEDAKNYNLEQDRMCDYIWDFKSSPLNGWEKTGIGDIYDLNHISNEFQIDFNVMDYIKDTSPDNPPSIKEIVRMVYVKQHELEIKQHDSKHHKFQSSTQ